MQEPEDGQVADGKAADGSLVLILAPTGHDADSASRVLGQEGIPSLQLRTLDELAARIDDQAGAVVLTSEALGSGSGAALVAAVRAQPAWSDLPFICLTPSRRGAGPRYEASKTQLSRSISNVLLLERPLSQESLVSAVRSGLSSRARQFLLRNEIEQLRQSQAALLQAAEDRARAEQALRDSAVEVARAEERDRVWQVSRDLLAVSDLQGIWRSVNPAWSTMLDWSAVDVVGRPVTELLHADDRRPMQRKLVRLKEGTPVDGFECRMVGRDGQHRTLSWSGMPDGGLVYWAARDITQQRTQAQALAVAEEQLRQAQKMESLGQLTGGIAHDFNNLLQGITASLAAIKRKAGSNPKDLERFIESANRSAMKAARLTHRLLAFSRRQPLAPSRVQPNALIKSLRDMLRQTVGESVELSLELAPDAADIACDANQLENAVLNLAINARDAMPSGGRLVVSTRNATAAEVAEVADAANTGAPDGSGGFVAIAVRDTGVGMPPDVASRAFDPFFTTKPLGQGTGLGLSMIYGFAQQSKGRCRITSAPDRGTTVTIFLPHAVAEHTDHAHDASTQAFAAGLHGEVAGRVLVVEDDDVIRALLVDALSESGLAVTQAADGPGGLNVIQSDTALDLLVTDVGLPGLNGRQLADAALATRPGLKVLFMTGYADSMANPEQSLPTGSRLMTKPFEIDHFIVQVADLLSPGREWRTAQLPAT